MKALVQSVTCALIPILLWRFRFFGKTAGTDEDDSQRFSSVEPKPRSSSIYELFTPSADSIALDIIFFHGFQRGSTPDVHVSTWRSSSKDAPEVIWPQAWLPAKYPQARVLTVSYDASLKITDTEGRMDLYLIGEALLAEILHVRQTDSHPIILVGHSFGGLVIKQLCTHAFQRKLSNADLDESFLRCIEGILFYGTPHRGMEIPRSWVDSFREAPNEPLLKFVDQLSGEAARLHEKFEENWRSYGWKIYTVNETHAPSGGEQLVSEASARCGSNNIFVSSDHYSTCRPASQECTKYLHLCELIGSVFDQIKIRKNVLEDFISGLVLDEKSKGELLGRAKGHFQKHPFFGFAGMAGTGKTAMAKLVGKCFATDLGSEFVLLAPVPQNSADFVTEVKAKLSGQCKKLLVILDDIPDLDHMHAHELRELAVKSGQERIRFIATSRDMGRLRKLLWPKFAEIWNVPLLKFEAAKKLFSSNAFPLGRIPPDHLKELIDEVVEGCAGLPLCLETVGGYLEGRKDVSIWKEIARALREADDESGGPLDGVWKQLKASLDSLHEEEKEMLLDVAYLLLSADSLFSFDEFETTWISTYQYAAIKWQTLLDRFLVQEDEVKKKVEPKVVGPGEATQLANVSIPETSEIQVHDHLKAIGKKSAQKLCRDVQIPPGGRPAVGDTTHLGEIVAVRTKVQSDGSSFEVPVEGVQDNPCCEWKNQTLHTTPESVRYLMLKVPRACIKCKVKGGLQLPRGLCMLQWRGSTSDIIKLGQQPSFWQSLVVLKLKRDDKCCLDILSPEMCRNLSNLQRLSLESKDMSLTGLAELRELRYLEIQCELLGSLPDFRSLCKLEFLCLKECSEFKTWDDGMDFKSLSSLKTLMLESCLKLKTLPSQFKTS
ncbi:hypothetical protein R1sor_014801 [Riccia sorocarpa]|uniref:AAA+ ATPase domain-containing protein n=1 Tax=Riccia sorocarpa TaxID=122646 RepID=A0ABD3HD21_9MARC